MRTKIKYTVFLSIIFIALSFYGVIPSSAYFAFFLIDAPTKDVELSALESTALPATISASPAFTDYYDYGGEAPYRIDKLSVDLAPDLCPYIKFEPTEGELTEFGNVGEINHPIDESDTWNVKISAPCFEGECPADYNPALSGARLSQAMKDKTFKCDLEVVSRDPAFVENFFGHTAYAQVLNNRVTLSAVIHGGVVAPKPDPVIIIPGISGTELYNGTDLIWLDLKQMLTDINDQFLKVLILDSDGNSIGNISKGSVIQKIGNVNIFADLLTTLESNNYTLSDNLFFFPYDWRLNLDDTKDLLKQKIDEVKAQTGSNKVDIIAHSMGGLLVKDYINQYGKDSIDKLIFIGTPHLGAPKAGKVLLEGDRLGIPVLEEDRIQEITKNSPAAYELLPNQTYFNNFSGYIKPFTIFSAPFYDFAETKYYLLGEGLNGNMFNQAENFFAKNLQDTDLSGINVYNIAGCKRDTQVAYEIALFGNIGMIGYGTGDETVPLASADYINIPAEKKYYTKETDHSELPSASGVKNAIVKILSGEPITTTSDFKNDSAFCGIKGKVLSWHSPVEVHIYDSQNKHAGPTGDNIIEEGIPGVGYDIIGHETFIFLPTDNGEVYRVDARGTGNGTFDLRIGDNDNGNIIDTNIFNDIPVSPTTQIKFSVTNTSADDIISVDQGNGVPGNVSASAVLQGDAGTDVFPPVTIAGVNGTGGDNGWYRSNVQITLGASDDKSGVMETRYSINGGAIFLTYGSPIVLNTEGLSALKYFSIDKAGNDEEIKTLEVKIDKTPPEISTWLDTQTKAFTFGVKDNLDQNPTILCVQVQCAARDQAGNTAKLNFDKYKLLSIYTLILKSISYNDNLAQKLTENALLANFEDKNGVIKTFNQDFYLKKQEFSRIEYNPLKNESTIYTLKNGGGFSKQIVLGKKSLQVATSIGNLTSVVK